MSYLQVGGRHNILLDKSFSFGVRMFRLGQYLQREQREFIVAKQIVRSGTSIGANAEEAVGAISKAEFSSKIFIAYKEARETSYWLRLLRASECLPAPLFDSLHTDCQELCRILFAILRSSGRA
jgi:four helix bundle protein